MKMCNGILLQANECKVLPLLECMAKTNAEFVLLLTALKINFVL